MAAVEQLAANGQGRLVLIVLMAPVAILVGLWLASFPWFNRNDRCAIGSVTADQYRQLYDQAKAQRWSIWPGLSNGIFWPSDRVLMEPSPSFQRAQGER